MRRLASVRIRNIMGVEELQFKAGRWTHIKAGNGKLKTSVIEGIKAVVKGGHDATILRKGCEEGEVVLLLDDDTNIQLKVTADKTTRTITGPQVGKIRDGNGSKRYLDSLMDVFAVNPIAFIQAKPDARAKILLETVRLELSVEQRSKLTELGASQHEVTNYPALDVLNILHKRLYEHRTNINRSATEKRKTISALEESTVTGNVIDYDESIQRQEKEIQDLRDEKQRRETDQLRVVNQQKEEVRRAAQQKIDAINRDLLAELEKITQVEYVGTDIDPKIETLQVTLTELRTKRDEVQRGQAIRQQIASFDKDATEFEERSATLSDQLEQVNAIKLELIAKLPAGLEVQDGEVYADGIPFDRLNTAQKIHKSVQLMKHRVKDLPLMCVDGIEAFDKEHQELLDRETAAEGLQMIVTEVDHEGGMTVSAKD